MDLSHSWNIQINEKDLVFPCDGMGLNFDSNCTFYRAITIKAHAEVIYLWLCHLRSSSCSYDLVSRSKKKFLQTNLYNQPKLKTGQTVMDIFELISFEKNIQMTLSIKPGAGYPLEGLLISYIILKHGGNTHRLICKAIMKYKQTLAGMIAKKILPWGDLIMMRKQMLNIKRFAESQ